VVLLKLHFIYHPGTDRQHEKEVENYDDVQNLGLLCNVDLFHVAPNEAVEKSAHGSQRKPQSSQSNHKMHSSSATSPYSSDSHFTFPANPYAPQQNSVPTPAPPLHAPRPVAGYLPSDGGAENITHVGNYAITESSKCTHALVGATFVQPANVDYKGKKSLMFVFADLAVKIEGTFVLRYRMFDIFSKGYETNELAVQAECYGEPFKVYSTKEFPGLQASTDLTKQLARWGVRLNIREAERKRRKKGEQASPSPPTSTRTKRKKGVEKDRDASDDD